jgi:hypothetical protein
LLEVDVVLHLDAHILNVSWWRCRVDVGSGRDDL